MSMTSRIATRVARGALTVAQFGIELYLDLTPGLRMRGTRRLPENMGSGILGAEAATWWAISPSLLPRKWWVIAANVAISQGFGHAVATGFRFLSRRVRRRLGRGPTIASLKKINAAMHTAMGMTTLVVALRAPQRHRTQVSLAWPTTRLTVRSAIAGTVLGTLGYGALLLTGEAIQNSVDRTNHELRRFLPPVVSWPVALIAVALAGFYAVDTMVLRRWLSRAYKRAQELNLQVMSGSARPTEAQRSGSRASLERWGNLGRQGRAVVAAGPRARDITLVMGGEATEPIRIYIGLNEDRSPEEQAELLLAEMDRTGAFNRRAIVMMTSAGTGWLNDFITSPFEFLHHGDCAVVSMQYSFMPSAVSYIADRTTPVSSSRVLISALCERLTLIDEHIRPKFYLAGESLGAYGIADSFDSVEDMLASIDGAIFTGAPGFTAMHGQLTKHRDKGSIERLPVIDGGKHIRFTATENHLNHDYAGQDYASQWEFPRVVFAQHASDPVVWWDWSLLWSQPDWLREVGSRGVPAPKAQELDVFEGLRWVPFITGWQVGLDQVNSLDFQPGHGHVYRDEIISYWCAVLDVEITPTQFRRIARWVRHDMKRVRDENVVIPEKLRRKLN
ncbi:alpha/beta-hydrolase family protein [Corynebacterium cystitidis]|nr:alpha/beta-hydrolase family protein [Corynebacterium cystitidis]